MKRVLLWVGLGVGVLLLYRFVNKDSLIYVVKQSLPPVEAGMLNGMLWGDKSGFDKDFYQKLKDTGLVHIIVVSGANVILLVKGLVESFAAILERKRIIIVALILVWGYAGLVGWEMPIVRAVLMVSIFYWAQLLGRRFNLVGALILTVGIMVAAGGAGTLVSVSFWLSLVAFIGVVSYRGPRFGEVIWVNIWLTPILALVFGKISLVAPITNAVVLFLIETITIVGGIGAMLGVIFLPAGRVILMLIYPLLKYCVWVVEGMGGFKWASIGVGFNWWMLVGWYMVLGWWLIKDKIYPNPPLRKGVDKRSPFLQRERPRRGEGF